MVETLILHAGTPKTGTSSLQIYLDRQRAALLRQGILYPDVETRTDGIADAAKPKHQWMIKALCAPDGEMFRRKIDEILGQAGPIHTVVLSTEGLFNHWWDFTAAGREALASLSSHMSVKAWVWFREPVAFVRANYVQMLKNPRTEIACYGRDLSIDEMLDDRWFSKHLDYIGYIRDVEDVLGRGKVVPFAYRGDTVRTFLRTLGVTESEYTHLDENRTLGEFGAKLLRLVNRYDLSGEEKRVAVDHISKLDAMVGQQSQPLTIAAATADRIRHLAAASITALERDFGLSFASSASENANFTHER